MSTMYTRTDLNYLCTLAIPLLLCMGSQRERVVVGVKWLSLNCKPIVLYKAYVITTVLIYLHSTISHRKSPKCHGNFHSQVNVKTLTLSGWMLWHDKSGHAPTIISNPCNLENREKVIVSLCVLGSFVVHQYTWGIRITTYDLSYKTKTKRPFLIQQNKRTFMI